MQNVRNADIYCQKAIRSVSDTVVHDCISVFFNEIDVDKHVSYLGHYPEHTLNVRLFTFDGLESLSN